MSSRGDVESGPGPRRARWAALEAVRPRNAALAAVGAVAGALAGGAGFAEHGVALAMAGVVAACGTAGGNLFNDLMDVEVDRVAHPERPLLTGALGTRTAWTFVLILFALAVGLAVSQAALAGLVAVGLVALLVLYESRLKAAPLWGNLAVAIAAGALFPLGALIAGVALAAPLILGALAALAHLGRELVKDAQDATADRAVRRTFAVLHGPRAAALLGALVLLVAVLLSPAPVLVLGWSWVYLVAVSPAVVLFLAAGFFAVRDPARAQVFAKLAMALALVAFLLGVRT